MGLFEDFDRRVKKFDFIDVKLVQIVAMFLALIIVKLIPDIMNISIWWFVTMLVICTARPFYVFWFKE